MRDIALFAMLTGLCGLALLRPWLGVVGLAVLGAMHPQAYGGPWMKGFPAYKLLFLVTCAAVAIELWRTRRWPRLQWDWRLGVLALLFAHFVVTTWFALLPDTARARLLEVSLLLPPFLLTLVLIDSREKLRLLTAATAASIALVALKGGYWAIMTGFKDRVYGPPESQIGGNNEFAVALAMTIPLLVLWLRQSASAPLRWTIMGAIFLAYLSALISWSRGGLVTLAVMSALLVWHSKHKLLAAALLVAGVAVAAFNMPDAWLDRMETIASYEDDGSFRSRQDAWRQGLQYLPRDPWTGSGFDGWRAITARFGRGSDPAVRDWHSAYVEALVEHGVPGLVLWGALLFGTMVSLWRMAYRGWRDGVPWQIDHGGLLAAALAAYAVGGLTLGITYWEFYFQALALAFVALRLGRTAG